MEDKLLYKPNQLIMSTNKDISITQKKAYNYILFEAREQLKKDKEQKYFDFTISDIKKNSGIENTNNKRLKDDLVSLMRTTVELVQGDDWDLFPLLTRVTKRNGYMTIGLGDIIRSALISNDYYTTLNLLEIRQLTGKYSVILYEVYLRYKGKEIPYLTIDEFKQLTGTLEIKSYENFARLKAKVIEVAIAEIKDKIGISLFYTTKKKGRKVVGIKFKFDKVSKIKRTQSISGVQIIDTDLKKDIDKAKRNIYISKAWNKRVDNKIQRILNEQGEEYVKDLLKRAYEGCQSDIKTTLIQYINGIIRNIKDEEVENKVKQVKDIELNSETVKISELDVNLTKNKLLLLEEFNQMDEIKRKELEDKAFNLTIEKEDISKEFLLNIKKTSFKTYFNTISKNM